MPQPAHPSQSKVAGSKKADGASGGDTQWTRQQESGAATRSARPDPWRWRGRPLSLWTGPLDRRTHRGDAGLENSDLRAQIPRRSRRDVSAPPQSDRSTGLTRCPHQQALASFEAREAIVISRAGLGRRREAIGEPAHPPARFSGSEWIPRRPARHQPCGQQDEDRCKAHGHLASFHARPGGLTHPAPRPPSRSADVATRP